MKTELNLVLAYLFTAMVFEYERLKYFYEDGY